MKEKAMNRITFVLLFLLGLISLGLGNYMHIKASLAQWMIAKSWQSRMEGERPDVPWAWADTNVVAKLSIDALDQPQYVMNSDSGESLAFGPGHLSASALPADYGHSVIAGHRDSHFKFLANLKIGDLLEFENYKSQQANYRIIEFRIIDAAKEKIPTYEGNYLTLVTCYPFDRLAVGGSLRYLVLAEMVESA